MGSTIEAGKLMDLLLPDYVILTQVGTTALMIRASCKETFFDKRL